METIEYDFSKVDPFRNYEKEIDNIDFNKTADGKNDVSKTNKLKIDYIINSPVSIQEDVLRYKMICEVIKE